MIGLMKLSICALLTLSVFNTLAETFFPSPSWKEKPFPLASTDAVTGGKLSVFAGQYPKSFNYYLDQNSFTGVLFGYMYESLLTINPLTADFEPWIAKKWSVSENQRPGNNRSSATHSGRN